MRLGPGTALLIAASIALATASPALLHRRSARSQCRAACGRFCRAIAEDPNDDFRIQRCRRGAMPLCVGAVRQGEGPRCSPRPPCTSNAECYDRCAEQHPGTCRDTGVGNYCRCFACQSDADCAGYNSDGSNGVCDVQFGGCHTRLGGPPSGPCAGQVDCFNGSCCPLGYACDNTNATCVLVNPCPNQVQCQGVQGVYCCPPGNLCNDTSGTCSAP